MTNDLQQGTTTIIGYVLDWETGGLDCVNCGVTQLSVHAIRLNDFEKLGTFMRYILPYHKRTDVEASAKKRKLKSKFDDGESNEWMEYSDEALAVQGITMDILREKGIPLNDMVSQWIEWMDSITPPGSGRSGTAPILIGQNIPFDEGFISQVIEYTGTLIDFKKRFRGKEDFYGHWHPIMLDTIVMAQIALCHNPIDSYKLELICGMLGIELVDAHDADADVEATEAVVAVLGNRMRSDSSYSGSDLPQSQKEKTRQHFKI